MDARIAECIRWIQGETSSAHGLVVPVSGGSDSALTFWLCQQAQPSLTQAVHAGCRETLRESAWFERVGPVTYLETPGAYEEREEMRYGRFLAFALRRQSWLVGCRNRTEDVLMTYSLASRVATFLPIVGVWKGSVLAWSKAIGVPESILDSSRKADPECGRPEELAEIPIEVVDAYCQECVGEVAVDRARELRVEERRYLDSIRAYTKFKERLPIKGPVF